MFARTPTLAGLLTALACFLVGALFGEGWSQVAPHPGFPTDGVVVTVEVIFEPAAAPEPTAWPMPMPAVDPSALAPWPPPSPGSARAPACDPFGAEAPRCDRDDDAR